MIIKSINAENFGKLEKLNMDFSPGINVITGNNESGKSSVTRFIRYMLFGFTSRASDLFKNDKKRYSPWSSLDIKGEMEIHTESGNYLLRREQHEKNAPFCILDESGNPVFSGKSAGEVFFGVDAETYDRTAMISAGDVFYSDPETLSGAIKNMVFSADSAVDSESVLKKIDNLKKEILGKTQRSGILYELRLEKAELEQKRKVIEQRRAELSDVNARLARINSKIEEDTGIAEKLKKEYANLKAKQAHEKCERIEEIRQSANSAKKALENKSLEISTNGFLPGRSYLSDVNEAVIALIASEEELNTARHKRSLAQTEEAALYRNEKQMKFNSLLEESSKTPEELKEDVEILKTEAKKKKKIAIILACLVVTLPFSAIFFSKAKKAKQKLEELAKSFECEDFGEFEKLLDASRESSDNVKEAKEISKNAEILLEEKTEKRMKAAQALCTLLDKTGKKTSFTDTSLLAETAKEHIRKVSLDISELEELEKNEAAQRAQLEGALEGVADLEKLEKLSLSYDESLPVREQAKIEKELDFYLRAIDTLCEQKREYDKKAAVISENTRDSDELDEKYGALTSEIESLKIKHDALDTAYGAIKESYEEMQKNVSPILTENASKMFEAMTDDKYERLCVDSGLKLGCFEKGSAEYRSIEFLSSGALDAAYLCLRLALCEYLYKEKPVLVFDDAFSKLDDTRLKKALGLMEKLSKEYQIIILSCVDREKEALLGKANLISM